MGWNLLLILLINAPRGVKGRKYPEFDDLPHLTSNKTALMQGLFRRMSVAHIHLSYVTVFAIIQDSHLSPFKN